MAEASSPHGHESQAAEQGAAPPAAGVGKPDVGTPAEAEKPSAPRAAGEQCGRQPAPHEHKDKCIAQAAAVAGERPPAAKGDFEAVLSLLLPGLVFDGGPKLAADAAAPSQAPREVPATAEAAPAMLPCPGSSLAAAEAARRAAKSGMQLRLPRSSENGSGHSCLSRCGQLT